MNRRRFTISAISAVGVATALGARGSNFIANASTPPENVTTLNIQYALTNFKGYKLYTRTYNGRTYGPNIETTPGSTLSIKIVNKLPPNPPATVPAGSVPIPTTRSMMDMINPRFHGPMQGSGTIDAMNNPHGFNSTNLHVHGIQTTPHLFDPVGTSDPLAELIQIAPGETFQYDLPVPADHPSGLHWYHPHKHGATDVQVSGGMAGLLIVRGPIDEVPEIAAAREIFMVVQSLHVNPSKTQPGVFDREYVAYETPSNGGYFLSTQFTMMTVNGEGVDWIDHRSMNDRHKPLGVPQFALAPGEVVRLRFLNGTNTQPLMLALPGFETWQIGLDGINTLTAIPRDFTGKGTKLVTPENLFTAPMRLAMSGNRVEMLLRAPNTPGTYTLSSLANVGVDFIPHPRLKLANFVVSGAPVKMGVPTDLPVPTREYPVITQEDVNPFPKREYVLDEQQNNTLLFGTQGFTVNQSLYQESESGTQPVRGSTEEWTVVNKTSEAHPIHLHVNSFQLVKINDTVVHPVEVWDNFCVPAAVGLTPGTITIRIRFREGNVGKSVFHCHILNHEDTGMMRNFLIT